MPFDESGKFIPEPDTASRPVMIGTFAWLVAGAFVAITGFTRPELRQWAWGQWAWVCLVGVISGAGGLGYLRWRSRRERNAA